MPELSVCNLSFTYRRRGKRDGTAALRDVSFGLPAGSCVALIGPNGSGKTTLSKVMNGILRPARGEILLGGARIDPHRHPGRYVAYAFQNPDDQLFACSVRQELEFGPRNLRLPPDEVERNVREAAELLGLSDAMDLHPLDLPFTLRKRVSIAAALAMGRPWTVLDEPTLAQDYAFQVRLAEAFDGLTADGRGLVVITHEPEFALEACGRVLLLIDGRAEFIGTRGEWAAALQNATFDFENLAIYAAQRATGVAGATTVAELNDRIRATRTGGFRDERASGGSAPS